MRVGTNGNDLGTRSGSRRRAGRTRAAASRACRNPTVAATSSTASAGRLEQAARDLDAHLLDVRGRGATDLGTEHAGEVPGTHRDARGEPFDGVVVGGMLADPTLQLAQRIAGGALRARAAR